MRKILTFEQITDDRFDDNILEVLEHRIEQIKTALNKLPDVEILDITEPRKVIFDGGKNTQYRSRFRVTKHSRKTTWNDIYETVNEIKAVPYDFA